MISHAILQETQKVGRKRGRPRKSEGKEPGENESFSVEGEPTFEAWEDAEDAEKEEVVVEKQSASSETFLGQYFKEMALLDVLKPEEEFEWAKRIESAEVGLWVHLLSEPKVVDFLCAFVTERIETRIKGETELKREMKSVLRRRKRVSKPEPLPARYVAICQKVAKDIYWKDMDRYALFATLSSFKQWALEPATLREEQIDLRTPVFRAYYAKAENLLAHCQQLRNEFVKANLRLVVSIARRFNHGRMAFSDLIQEGNIGLIKAVERYDYRRGFRFSTYASWWIRHAISRALADKGRSIRLPVHMIDAYHKVSKTRRELSNKLGRQPTAEEIGASSGIAIDKVEKIEGSLHEQTVSLDRTISSSDDRRFVDLVHDPEQVLPSDALVNESTNREILQCLAELKPIEADILRKRFGLVGDRELTLKEIGEVYNLSRERIRQLQEQALVKIRRALMYKNSL